MAAIGLFQPSFQRLRSGTVNADRAALQQRVGLAFGRGQAAGRQGVDQRGGLRRQGQPRHAVLGQLSKVRGAEAFHVVVEQTKRDPLSGGERGRTVHQLGDLLGQDALSPRFAAGGAVFGLDGLDLFIGQKGEVAQKAVDVGVGRAQPELVEGVGRALVRVQPDRVAFALAELGAIAIGDQGHGQAEDLLLVHPSDQVDAGGDVAPLVGAADLQLAAETAVQLNVVVALEQAVGELGEGDADIVAVDPLLYGFLLDHGVD